MYFLTCISVFIDMYFAGSNASAGLWAKEGRNQETHIRIRQGCKRFEAAANACVQYSVQYSSNLFSRVKCCICLISFVQYSSVFCPMNMSTCFAPNPITIQYSTDLWRRSDRLQRLPADDDRENVREGHTRGDPQGVQTVRRRQHREDLVQEPEAGGARTRREPHRWGASGSCVRPSVRVIGRVPSLFPRSFLKSHICSVPSPSQFHLNRFLRFVLSLSVFYYELSTLTQYEFCTHTVRISTRALLQYFRWAADIQRTGFCMHRYITNRRVYNTYRIVFLMQLLFNCEISLKCSL